MDKHAELDSDQQSDSGESRGSGDGSSGSSSGDEDDEDEEELDKEEEELNRRAQMTTEELMAVARMRAAEGESVGDRSYRTNFILYAGAASGGVQKRHEGPKVCGTCLGDSSDHTNEIVECDGCGVAVHEACYGIQVRFDFQMECGLHCSVFSMCGCWPGIRFLAIDTYGL